MELIFKSVLIMAIISFVFTDDICKQPKPETNCLKRSNRFWFNSETRKCEEFNGCKSNDNNFRTSHECFKRCSAIGVLSSASIRSKRSEGSRCELAYDKGPCKNYTSRFYYNPQAKRCDLFIFGGCEGNGNNFINYKQCKDTCIQNKSPERNSSGNGGESGGNGNRNTSNTVCRLPKDTGDCRGNFKKYYFNSDSKSCQQFVYGGCFGNGNNFETIQECEQTCGNN